MRHNMILYLELLPIVGFIIHMLYSKIYSNNYLKKSAINMKITQ